MESVMKLLGGGAAALRDPRELRPLAVHVGGRSGDRVCDLSGPVVGHGRCASRPAWARCPARYRWPSKRVVLFEEHFAEREREAAFYERQDKRNAERLAEDPSAEPRNFQ